MTASLRLPKAMWTRLSEDARKPLCRVEVEILLRYHGSQVQELFHALQFKRRIRD